MKHILILTLISGFCCNIVFSENISISSQPRNYETVNDLFYNSNIFSINDNLFDRLAMAKPQVAEKVAKSFADMGIDVVIYSGRHFRLNYPDEWAQIAANSKIVTDAFHKYGIKVIEHHEFTIFNVRNYDMFLKYLDWGQEDIRTGEKYKWVCPSNPDFLNFYIEYLKNFQKVTNVDGYMLDEIGMAGQYTCGCKYCREDYKKASGEEMGYWPNANAGFDDAEHRNFARWRSHIPAKATMKIMAELRKIKPELTCLTYCSDYSDSTVVSRSVNLSDDAAMFSSFVGWEVMIANCLEDWRPWLRELKMRLSYADYYGIPVWSLNRQQMTKEGVYYAWALSQLGKHSIWYTDRQMSDSADMPYIGKFVKWKKVMPHKYARCITDTGFLLSNQTRFTNPSRDFFWHDAMGWADMLLEGNRQFDVLLDGDLELPNRLEKYKVLVLVGQSSLSRKQCDNLIKWVKDGGTLIFTAHTSLYDGFGEKLANFALSAPAGIAFKGQLSSQIEMKGNINGKIASSKSSGVYYLVETAPDAKVLISGKGGNGITYPAVVEKKFGKGKFLYVAGNIGAQNVEVEHRNGSTYTTRENLDNKKLIQTLVDYAHAGKLAPIILDFPEGAKGITYQQHGGENNGDIYVQIINTAGKNIRYGDITLFDRPDLEKITAPVIRGEMKIRINGKVKGNAILQSPEIENDVQIKPAIEDGYTEFAIPCKYLKTYLQVRIAADIVPGQIVQDVPMFKEVKE